MEDFSEQSGFDDNQIGYDGEEEQFEQPQEQQQFDSGREFEANHNVDSEGNEFRESSFRADSAAGKLFVGGVSWETTEETFTNYFSKYGEIADSVIMLDKHTGRPRGFGFVTFSDPVAADAVLEEEHVIDGRVVEVKRTVPREDMGFKGGSKRKKIFVGGIPTSLNDEELGEYFSTFGSIVEHQIMVDHKTGRSRGFGFVTFENEDALDKVFSEGKIHELGGKQVEIKRAEPKRPGGDFSGSAARSYGGLGGPAAGYGGYNSGGRFNGKWAGAMADLVVMALPMGITTIMLEIMLRTMQVSMVAMVDMDMVLGMADPCMAMLDMERVVMACLVVMVLLLVMVVVKGMEVVLLVGVKVGVGGVVVVVMMLVEDMIGVVIPQLEDIILIKIEERFC